VFLFWEICCDGVRICMGRDSKPLDAGRSQLCPENLKNGFNLRVKPFNAACLK